MGSLLPTLNLGLLVQENGSFTLCRALRGPRARCCADTLVMVTVLFVNSLIWENSPPPMTLEIAVCTPSVCTDGLRGLTGNTRILLRRFKRKERVQEPESGK